MLDEKVQFSPKLDRITKTETDIRNELKHKTKLLQLKENGKHI